MEAFPSPVETGLTDFQFIGSTWLGTIFLLHLDHPTVYLFLYLRIQGPCLSFLCTEKDGIYLYSLQNTGELANGIQLFLHLMKLEQKKFVFFLQVLEFLVLHFKQSITFWTRMQGANERLRSA